MLHTTGTTSTAAASYTWYRSTAFRVMFISQSPNKDGMVLSVTGARAAAPPSIVRSLGNLLAALGRLRQSPVVRSILRAVGRSPRRSRPAAFANFTINFILILQKGSRSIYTENIRTSLPYDVVAKGLFIIDGRQGVRKFQPVVQSTHVHINFHCSYCSCRCSCSGSSFVFMSIFQVHVHVHCSS